MHKSSGCAEVESHTSDIMSPLAMQPLYQTFHQPTVHSSQYLSAGYAMAAPQDSNWAYANYANTLSSYPTSTSAVMTTVQPASYGNWFDNSQPQLSQHHQQSNMLYALEPSYSTHSQRHSPRSSHHTPSSSQGSISTPHNRSPAPTYHSPTGSPVQLQVGMPTNDFTTYANLNYRNTTLAHNSYYQ